MDRAERYVLDPVELVRRAGEATGQSRVVEIERYRVLTHPVRIAHHTPSSHPTVPGVSSTTPWPAVALGEPSQVQQLPPGHHEVADRHQRCERAGAAHDDLEQQTGRVRPLRREDVGHDGAQDAAGELHAGVDREDPAEPPSAGRGEGVPDLRFRESYELLRGSASEVVDPVVGVRGEPDLGDPRPDDGGRRGDGDAPPRLQRGGRDELVARVGAGGLGVGHAPAVTDHGSIVHPTPPAVRATNRAVVVTTRGRWPGPRTAPSWSAAVAEAEHRFGRLTVLVNNAGVQNPPAPIETTEASTWRRVLDIDLTGAFFGIKAVTPALRRAGGGSITNIGSVMGTGVPPTTRRTSPPSGRCAA
nr:SDR family NAD(P)-dependent oxidoreductase [Pseudonocardia sp. SID8383]